MEAATALLVYDGDCAFCTSSANAIARRWHGATPPTAVPYQRLDPAVASAAGLTNEEMSAAAWWLDGARRDVGSRAVARALIAAGGGLGVLGRLLLVPPLSLVAPFGYRVVAKNRHRLPGGTPACRL
jgi:predicted DCC family thiol-disulfide oxidoreductase YuxK